MEVDRPQPVVGFLQTDPLIGECIGDLEQPLAEVKRAARGDGLREEVARVVRDGQSRRTGTR